MGRTHHGPNGVENYVSPNEYAKRRRAAGPPKKRVCKNCHERIINRGGGLCWRCWTDPAIRKQFKARPASGEPDVNGPRPLPDCPTDEKPGSEEKVLVLIDRAKAKRELWHPLDRPINLR